MAKKQAAEGEAINLRESVELYATGKGFHKQGDVVKCHPKLAEYFIQNDFARESEKEAKAFKAEETKSKK